MRTDQTRHDFPNPKLRVISAFLLGWAASASLLLAVRNDPVLVLSGIPAAEAVAVSPQGSPMVAMSSLGGGIARVVGRDSTKLLAETAGLPAGLAYDRAGDLYVTDRQLGSLFRIHHNIYFETSGFNLSQMPDKYRSEWQANSDWMRLTFHARANDPARPYIHASAEQIREDYRLVTREIERFAGRELLSPVTTIHWAIATRAAARALRQEGVRVLLGVDAFRDDIPYVGYYLTVPQLRSVLGRDYWKDLEEDIIFIHHDMVINHVSPGQVGPRLEQLTADRHQSEVIELIIHEQYFYPEYRAYEPDYRERVERAIEWISRRGYKPVFFEEGFLGAKPKQ